MKYEGPKDLPFVKFCPKQATLTRFCLKPILNPDHPSPKVSVIVTLITIYRAQFIVGQNVLNTVVLLKVEPETRVYTTVLFKSLTTKPISDGLVPVCTTTISVVKLLLTLIVTAP